MKKRYILPLAALIAMPAAAQQTRLLTADKHNEYGVVYSLPRTAFRIEVKALREISKAGPYFRYAKKFIGTDKVVREDAERWSITGVTVTPYGVADPDARYLMQSKAGAMTFLAVAEDGALLAINKEVSQAVPGVVAGRQAAPTEAFTGKEYLQYVDEDFLASQSSAKQAEMLAASLMEVRDAKVSLSRGTADTMPTDGRQLELMLQSLSDQEETMTAAFAGTVTRQEVTRTFTFIPEDEGTTVLFRMSDFAGFVEADDYSGDPVEISVKVVRDATLPVDAKGEEKRMPKDAVVYALPGTVNISLSTSGKTLWSEDCEVAQFGTVFGLSPSLFSDKKNPSYAIFNPATGALIEIGEVSAQ